jgi:prepilin-type N-terminal cleavage/methylation domain-containing protein/prepilin-type processing-associated H-X9-DG protein
MRRTRAFTLVELLVVIGIIAVLVGILLPTLSGVRRQAEQTKCATALREIGMAVLNYVNDNRGYMIPARVSNNYNLDGIRYGAASEVPNVSTVTPAYWISFLAKYVTKGKVGTASTTGWEAAEAQKTVLWGCPTFERYVSNTIGGFNRIQNGYGFNYTPTYTANDPPLMQTYPRGYADNSLGPNRPGLNSILASTNQWRQPTPTSGTWFKANRYTKPAQRVLVADGQFWIIEAYAPPLNGDIPPQKIYNNTNTYSDGISGQTLYDFYRHGKYPPIERHGPGGYYSKVGGKVAYNILYCDGHVSGTQDRRDAYRAMRQRFPG